MLKIKTYILLLIYLFSIKISYSQINKNFRIVGYYAGPMQNIDSFKAEQLTPNGEQPVRFKPSYGKGIVIEIPERLPFASLSVLKIEKIETVEKKQNITD
jgi:hypothetical protein